MGKFNANQRAIIGTNCIAAIQKSGNKKQVAVYCASKEGGEQVAGTIQAAYPGYTAYKSVNRAGNVFTFIATGVFGPAGTAANIAGNTWKNFTIATGSQANAKKLVSEINECIAEYGGATGDVEDIAYITGSATNSGSGIGKTALYLIAGAVVAVVLAVVLTRKKK